MNSELSTETGLVASYHFNEGVADGNNAGVTTAADASGNGNNGTLNNFALSGTASNWVEGNVGSAPTVTNDAPATYPIGNTTVTWTATDASNNSASATQVVTVVDNEAPSITAAGPVTINNTPGLCSGTTTLVEPTVIDNCTSTGNALDFDGVDDYVEVGVQPISPTLFTVEAWVNGNSLVNSGRFNRIVAINYGSYNYDNPFCLFVMPSGKIGYVFGSGNSTLDGQVPLSASPVLSVNTWYHVALTFDGTAKRLYVNGLLAATVNNSSTFTNPNNEPLLIGDFKINESNNGEWEGKLDEVRIWNTARTQAQIQANMNNELSAAAGLVASYHLNEGVADGNNAGITTATDASGNGNDGTLNNFALSGTASNWVA